MTENEHHTPEDEPAGEASTQAADSGEGANVPTQVNTPMSELSPFCDQYGTEHVSFPKNTPANHREIWPVRSKECSRWMIGRLLSESGEVPSAGEIERRVRLLE